MIRQSSEFRWIFFLFWLLTVVTLSHGKPSFPHGCSYDQSAYTHSNGTITCVSCPVCPPGSGSSVVCDGTTTTTWPTCVPCVNGSTYNDKNTSFECMPCMTCGDEEYVVQQCTPDRPTRCECKKGTYKDPHIHECAPCSPCCGSRDPAFFVEKCRKDEMPENQQCKAYDSRCDYVPVPEIQPSPTLISSPTSITTATMSRILYAATTTSTVHSSKPEPGTSMTETFNLTVTPTRALGAITTKTSQIILPSRNDFVIVITNPLTYVIAGVCSFAVCLLLNCYKRRQKHKIKDAIVHYTAVSQDPKGGSPIDQTSDNASYEPSIANVRIEGLQGSKMKGGSPGGSRRSSGCSAMSSVSSSLSNTDDSCGPGASPDPDMSCSCQKNRGDGSGPVITDSTGRQALMAEFRPSHLSTSIESILTAVKDASVIQDVDLNILMCAGAYIRQLMQTKVSDLPIKYRRSIGLGLAVPQEFGYDGRLFLENIGVPMEEINAIWKGVLHGTVERWEVILDEFTRKTNGRVGTLRDTLQKTDRLDIVEKIHEWMREKCKEELIWPKST